MKPEFNHIKETCLYVTDLDITRNFYEKQLGLEVIGFVEGRHVFFRVGSSVLLCFIAESTRQETKLPSHFGMGQLHLALEVPTGQYQLWKNKLQSSGIAIEQETDWGEGLKSFYFRDPDQHLLEIIMPGIWERNK